MLSKDGQQAFLRWHFQNSHWLPGPHEKVSKSHRLPFPECNVKLGILRRHQNARLWQQRTYCFSCFFLFNPKPKELQVNNCWYHKHWGNVITLLCQGQETRGTLFYVIRCFLYFINALLNKVGESVTQHAFYTLRCATYYICTIGVLFKPHFLLQHWNHTNYILLNHILSFCALLEGLCISLY